MRTYPSNCTLLRIETVAEMAGVSKPTVYDWIRKGFIAPTHDVEGSPVFTPEAARDVAQLADQRRQVEEARRGPKVMA